MNYHHPSKCYQFLTLGWSSWKTKWISDEMLMQKGPVQNRFLALNHSVNNNAMNIYHCQIFRNLKFDNLQYNMLVRWVPGTNDWSTKCLMFQVLSFFIISCKILCRNCFNLLDTWLMSRSSHRPINQGYHIEDCWIFALFS